ncbi:hypothetical protein AcW2_000079 [Taiwanofungus camphoratus]|nr:hypothetical protein AcW2_000079 [Antrodia cinnamomea]
MATNDSVSNNDSRTISSRVKSKLRSLSRHRSESWPASEIAPSDVDSETSTLVNFVIDNTNETSFIREEGAQEGFEVRPSPSSQSTGSPSTFDPVQSQEFDDAQLEGDNTAWTNGNQRTAARKEIKRRLPSVSRARDGPSENRVIDPNNLAQDMSSKQIQQQYGARTWTA